MTIVRTAPATPIPHPSAPRDGAARDTGIDFVRALCVVGVVVLHAMMVGVTVADGGPVFHNAAAGSVWITPLSWVLQVMPLFFVIGGFSGLSPTAGSTPGAAPPPASSRHGSTGCCDRRSS